jgi:hypothetical protein
MLLGPTIMLAVAAATFPPPPPPPRPAPPPVAYPPPIPPCVNRVAPFDMARIRKVQGVLDVLADAEDKSRVTVFIDTGDVVKLHIFGCQGGVIQASLWTGYIGYSIQIPTIAAPVEKKLIQRAKIVTRLIFPDTSDIKRIDGIMDAGHFLPYNADYVKSFSDQTHGVFMDLQQPPGDQDALISLLYVNPPMVKQ